VTISGCRRAVYRPPTHVPDRRSCRRSPVKPAAYRPDPASVKIRVGNPEPAVDRPRIEVAIRKSAAYLPRVAEPKKGEIRLDAVP
jgi:hypothetical protein